MSSIPNPTIPLHNVPWDTWKMLVFQELQPIMEHGFSENETHFCIHFRLYLPKKTHRSPGKDTLSFLMYWDHKHDKPILWGQRENCWPIWGPGFELAPRDTGPTLPIELLSPTENNVLIDRLQIWRRFHENKAFRWLRLLGPVACSFRLRSRSLSLISETLIRRLHLRKLMIYLLFQKPVSFKRVLGHFWYYWAK